ncbi:folate receptor alpha [Plakobranchus ocellatus]|uniref:Folate receptor alpha n=1 Tax=Plakobranchus ocellatus TaxID=259542 RepID=A0AAV4C234_9GAST|nr:folate receptor alpha [Plakobranchus ocellatus]
MEKIVCTCILTLFCVKFALSRLDGLKTVESYMNICMLGKYHKSSPSPEKGLVSKFCSPWAVRSCCTEETALDIHVNSAWLNFDWNHCGQLSSRCREYFIMDSCFYSCSPNVGPWLVEDVRKIRKERFKNVPLCEKVCDNWYEACKDDLTCTDEWAKNFNWSTGINTCPHGSACRKFSEVFQNKASTFCEKVFGSFKVVPEDPNGGGNCFHLWFDPRHPNPNEAVARRRASEILNVEYKVVQGSESNNGHNKAVQLDSRSTFVVSMVVFTAVLADYVK